MVEKKEVLDLTWVLYYDVKEERMVLNLPLIARRFGEEWVSKNDEPVEGTMENIAKYVTSDELFSDLVHSFKEILKSKDWINPDIIIEKRINGYDFAGISLQEVLKIGYATLAPWLNHEDDIINILEEHKKDGLYFTIGEEVYLTMAGCRKAFAKHECLSKDTLQIIEESFKLYNDIKSKGEVVA